MLGRLGPRTAAWLAWGFFRLTVLGGGLEVRSARGTGTTVEAWIPAGALEPIA
jgi:hypothetical protein